MNCDFNFNEHPKPRLCHVLRWTSFNGYGFHLRTKANGLGHFVESIEEEGPAQYSGLWIGDRIIEINGVNVEKESHSSVIGRIRNGLNGTLLLVADEFTYRYLKMNNINIKGSKCEVVEMRTPSIRPQPEKVKFELYDDEDSIGESKPAVPVNGVENKVRHYFKRLPSFDFGQARPNDTIFYINSGSTKLATSVSVPHRINDLKGSPKTYRLRRGTHVNDFGFSLKTVNETGEKLIVQVDDQSPAERTGLKVSDRVIEINGIDVTDETHEDVVRRILSSGDILNLMVVDEIRRNSVSMKTGHDLNGGNEDGSDDFCQNIKNMTVEQMKQKISRRRKYDPRHLGIDFSKRFEIYEKL